MLKLDNHLTIDSTTIKSTNLCDRFSKDDLDRIGDEVWRGYTSDRASRSAWEKRTESAMDLALQIQKDKSFPWPNCSNVAFPLITIAVLQFHARAYPAIVSGAEVVRCRVIGEDSQGVKRARADRVSTHMSYQVMEEDQAWEEQHDRQLINLAVVGCNFIKTYQDATKGYAVSELVTAKDLVVNYWAKSIEACPRKTHVIPFSRNEVHERVLSNTFRDVLEEEWYISGSNIQQTPEQVKSDNRAGVRMPLQDDTTPLMVLEQHCSLDLDGDGYAEPYIITIDEGSKAVLRIVTRFDREEDIKRVLTGARKGQIISIAPMEYFTKYSFIPSPDGGIYDIGFGVLTGPLNESVNSLVNQLIDAGTMATTGGGFLGRGAKIRGGAYTFAPLEWKRVDSTGDDLRKSIVPLEVREPSGVLLQLLSLLINYTNRISGSTDMMAGENPGQNTPAETSRTMVEQGAKIYTAIFKRVWRSMKEEFKKRYILNAIFMPVKTVYGETGAYALREDYLGDPGAIVPAADPNIASEEAKLQKAIAVKQSAMTTSGYNITEVEKRFLRAMHIEGIEIIYPGVGDPKDGKVLPLPNPKMLIEQSKTEREKLKLEAAKMEFVMELEETKRLNDAHIAELRAKSMKELAEAGGIGAGQEIKAFEAVIGAIEKQNAAIDRQKKLTLEGMKNEQNQSPPDRGGVPGMANAPGQSGAAGSPGGMA